MVTRYLALPTYDCGEKKKKPTLIFKELEEGPIRKQSRESKVTVESRENVLQKGPRKKLDDGRIREDPASTYMHKRVEWIAGEKLLDSTRSQV